MRAHQTIVREIVSRHGAKTRCFGKTLRDTMGDMDEDEFYDTDWGYIVLCLAVRASYIPDAYIYKKHKGRHILHIFEVVDHNMMTKDKYTNYFWAIDAAEHDDVRLIMVANNGATKQYSTDNIGNMATDGAFHRINVYGTRDGQYLPGRAYTGVEASD